MPEQPMFAMMVSDLAAKSARFDEFSPNSQKLVAKGIDNLSQL